MKKLTLKDFKFTPDHDYVLKDITLVPVFGGFDIYHRGNRVESKLSMKQALEAVEKYLEEVEQIKEDHILGDYLLNKDESCKDSHTNKK